MDRIAIDGIRVSGRHGWTIAERSTPQPLTIDLELELDLRDAGSSDDLQDTVDYAALHQRVVGIVESTSFALLEKLGASLLDAVFEDWRIVRATLRIAKPELLDGATPTVILHRENPRAQP